MILERRRELLAQRDTAWLVIETAMPVQFQIVCEIEWRLRRGHADVIDVNRVTTANGSVATNSVSMTMNGTLSTFDVNIATFRRISLRAADQNAGGEYEQAADN